MTPSFVVCGLRLWIRTKGYGAYGWGKPQRGDALKAVQSEIASNGTPLPRDDAHRIAKQSWRRKKEIDSCTLLTTGHCRPSNHMYSPQKLPPLQGTGF